MKILLADDHGLVREALKTYLERQDDTMTVIIGSSRHDAVAQAEADDTIDLAILDLRMPGMNGMIGLTRFIDVCPDIPVAIISGFATDEDVRKCLELGAVGFFPKTLTGPALMNAIRLVMSGERFIPYDVSNLMPPELLSAIPQTDPSAEALAVPLTPREKSVMRWLMDGHSNKEIARELDLQEVTVKLHMRSICRKLEVKNRTQAALKARSIGLDKLVLAEAAAA